ncbi:MAG: hypothetical protein PUA82_03760 [Eubacteriales bacterium]|nr:hypothetical protein [Eubacteriales bacterium]
MNGEATDKSLKTVLQMVLMIVESSETKEEAVEKIKSLELLRDDGEADGSKNGGRGKDEPRELSGSSVISQPGRVGAQKKLPPDTREGRIAQATARSEKKNSAGNKPDVIEQPGRVGAQKKLPDRGTDSMQTLGEFLRSAADAAREAEKKAAEAGSNYSGDAKKLAEAKKAAARSEKPDAAKKHDGAAQIKEQQKSEALRRMKALNLLPSIVEDFRKNGTIYMSGEEGMLYFPDQEQLDLVRRFEKRNNVLVYHIINEVKSYGECCTMLYIPADPSGWKSFDKNIRDGLVDAYVYNMTKPDMSEAGLIQVKSVNGGLQRFDVMDFLFH